MSHKTVLMIVGVIVRNRNLLKPDKTGFDWLDRLRSRSNPDSPGRSDMLRYYMLFLLKAAQIA